MEMIYYKILWIFLAITQSFPWNTSRPLLVNALSRLKQTFSPHNEQQYCRVSTCLLQYWLGNEFLNIGMNFWLLSQDYFRKSTLQAWNTVGNVGRSESFKKIYFLLGFALQNRRKDTETCEMSACREGTKHDHVAKTNCRCAEHLPEITSTPEATSCQRRNEPL